jgi:hypothetical protein
VGKNRCFAGSTPKIMEEHPTFLRQFRDIYIWRASFFLFFFGVFQPGFVAFVASVAAVAFVGVWLLWLYHALPIYISIYLI